MGGFIDRPFALFVLLMSALSAPLASAQTIEQAPTSLALASTDAAILDMRLSKPLSRGEEAALRPKDRFRECAHCPEMVVVPDGSFMMGASASEMGSTEDERPQHQVTVLRFAAGRWPVSVDEWNACVAARACSPHPTEPAEHERDPVTGILWQEAGHYVQWLSRSTGRPYRLLSEAEREYAARGGTTTAFWWGDGPDPHLADIAAANLVADIGIVTIATTASAPPSANPFGLFEVHGGVYDWVEDCWHDNYVGAPNDGSAWIADDCKGHVLRGGAFGRALQTRRSAARLWFGPPNRMSYMSVRVARTLAP
ncbi:formylglycine-generating enzyme family protein [Bradyrhizobium sp. CCGUVB1N3]|uniref:formylglycine-generating enzyme family protein n=1 Tax=Bradyrhizobium sp. CCGUVB1N3 TaxID=2949629 RepID=UPI0020B1AFE1|nr:formylglycine-generating enzyme family protein [Bradyrhizobium sp. CCGUVB1N3]MCP3476186.1 formylglycine-generating enzyme family protein [Bradyrhizobium sp. CCGUVB1N3]